MAVQDNLAVPRRRGLSSITSAGVAGVFFAVTIVGQAQIERYRAPTGQDELLYLPNEKLLNHFTGGMDSIIADFLWLKCVQYTAIEAKGSRNFAWLNHMVNTAVRLDPHFVDVYRYGAMFLAALKADSNAGLELLERGMIANPKAWELPYEAAMIYLLNRKDEPDARRQAAFYLTLCSATGNAPKAVTDVAAKLGAEEDLGEIERDMWLSLIKSDDELLRDLAARKLQELDIRGAVRILDERIAAFRQATGRAPRELQELLDVGLLKGLPPDPLGGRYFISPSGKVQNTTLLDDRKTQDLNFIRDALERYKKSYGTYPARLDDLVQADFLNQIPPHPYEGQTWQYNPATGEIKE
ncbi:MAG: hypothetical protein HYV26_16390 [Candidatus Hydrogenedentes bacterium]|nr:hypothetical protein [Candidatus Hydrogenedentota bacterium]